MRVLLLSTVIALSTMSTVSSVEWSAEWITSTAGWANEPGWAYPGGDVFQTQLKTENQEDDVEACRTICQKKEGANFFTYRKNNRKCFCKKTKGTERRGGPVKAENAHSGTVLNQDRKQNGGAICLVG